MMHGTINIKSPIVLTAGLYFSIYCVSHLVALYLAICITFATYGCPVPNMYRGCWHLSFMKPSCRISWTRWFCLLTDLLQCFFLDAYYELLVTLFVSLFVCSCSWVTCCKICYFPDNKTCTVELSHVTGTDRAPVDNVQVPGFGRPLRRKWDLRCFGPNSPRSLALLDLERCHR